MNVKNDIKFGTDGWRGIIAWDFTFAGVRKLAQALADFALAEITAGKGKISYSVAVGCDNRFLSDKFALETAKILASNKIKVVLSKTPVPTPAMSVLTKKGFALAVMVTASHNPFHYNGIKIKIGGYSAGKNVTDKIESLIGKHSPLIEHSAVVKTKDFRPDYLKYVKSRFNLKSIVSRIRKPVVIDYMFGVQAGIFENFLPSKKLITLHNASDPFFNGTDPEPTENNLKDLMSYVIKNKAAVGFAFDGDGDRVAVIDEKGSYITPCQLFAVLVKYLSEEKKLKGKLVQTVSMGYPAKRIARKKGFDFEQVPVGFKNISEKMSDEQNIIAGAEESGGYAWKGIIPERDGVMTALMVLEIMAKRGKKMSELTDEVQAQYGKSVFARKDFKLNREIPDTALFVKRLVRKLPKKILSTKVSEIIDIDGVKVMLENDFWFLVRLSGTEKRLRIYAETDNKKTTNDLINYGAKLIAHLLK